MSTLLWILIDLLSLGVGPPATPLELPVNMNGEAAVIELADPAEGTGVWRCLSEEGHVMIYGGAEIPGLTDGPSCVHELEVAS